MYGRLSHVMRKPGSLGPNASSCGQQILWSDWVDAQGDPSLRWAHMSFCWFCHEAALFILPVSKNEKGFSCLYKTYNMDGSQTFSSRMILILINVYKFVAEHVHLTTLITSPITFVLYFKNGKSIQHEIFTIAKSFSETNNHVKMIGKYFVIFTAYIRIWDYPQFQKLQKTTTNKQKKQKTNKQNKQTNCKTR